MGPQSDSSEALRRSTRRHLQAQGRGPCTGGAEMAVMLPHAKEQQGWLATARRGQEGFFPRSFGGSMALPTPWFWTSGLWDSETVSFCGLKPPSLRNFVKAAPGRNCDLPLTTMLEPVREVEALLPWNSFFSFQRHRCPSFQVPGVPHRASSYSSCPL